MKCIRHLGIVVSNMKEALFFYHNLLGLRVQKNEWVKGPYIDKLLGIRDVEVRTIKLSAGTGSVIELLYYRFPSSRGKKVKRLNEIGLSHFAILVKDIDKEYIYLKNKGVIFNSQPLISPHGYAKVAFCRDPDGNFIELVELLRIRRD